MSIVGLFHIHIVSVSLGLAGPGGAPAYPNAPYVINQEPYMQTLIAGKCVVVSIVLFEVYYLVSLFFFPSLLVFGFCLFFVFLSEHTGSGEFIWLMTSVFFLSFLLHCLQVTQR